MECSREENGNKYVGYPTEFQETGLYHFICPMGLVSYICLQEQKFEILYGPAPGICTTLRLKLLTSSIIP